MPHPGQVEPETGERLSDRIAVGLLTRTFPPELVDRVVAECGRSGLRTRLLPPQVVVYFVLAMCLFSGQGYEEVARLLTQGLTWAKRWPGRWRVASTAAISRSQAKPGPEPSKALFAEVARPLATEETHGARYGRWRLVAIVLTLAEVGASQHPLADLVRLVFRVDRVEQQGTTVVAVARVKDALVHLHVEAHALFLAQVEQRDPLPRPATAPARLPQPRQVGPESVGARVVHEPLEVVAGLLGVAGGGPDVLVGLAQRDAEVGRRLGVLPVLVLPPGCARRKDPLEDRVRSAVFGFDGSRITGLAARTLRLAQPPPRD